VFGTIYYESVGSLSAITNNYPILTYKVLSVTGDTSGSTGTVYLQLDRDLPRYGTEGYTGLTRAMIYPSGMTELYDTFTPEFYSLFKSALGRQVLLTTFFGHFPLNIRAASCPTL